jgi:hypothetical protein
MRLAAAGAYINICQWKALFVDQLFRVGCKLLLQGDDARFCDACVRARLASIGNISAAQGNRPKFLRCWSRANTSSRDTIGCVAGRVAALVINHPHRPLNSSARQRRSSTRCLRAGLFTTGFRYCFKTQGKVTLSPRGQGAARSIARRPKPEKDVGWFIRLFTLKRSAT